MFACGGPRGVGTLKRGKPLCFLRCKPAAKMQHTIVRYCWTLIIIKGQDMRHLRKAVPFRQRHTNSKERQENTSMSSRRHRHKHGVLCAVIRSRFTLHLLLHCYQRATRFDYLHMRYMKLFAAKCRSASHTTPPTSVPEPHPKSSSHVNAISC